MSQREADRRIQAILDRMKVDVRPFADDTPAARRARVKRVMDGDFGFFCTTYLPHHFSTSLSDFHQELAELAGIRGKPVAVAAPSGHGKSTLLGTAYTLSEICRRARHFVIIGSATEDVATVMTRILKLELEHNERIKGDFGEMKGGDVWGDGWFITSTGIAVLARGQGQAIRGFRHGPHRPDLCIIDDPETLQSARSPERVKGLLDWVKRDILPRMCRGLRWSLVWLGTILARRSALDRVMREEEPEYAHWLKRLYSAEVAPGVALCPELHTWEELQQLRQTLGTAVYHAELLNDPIDEAGLFREDWFSTYRLEEVASDLGGAVSCAFIDPSLGETKRHDMKSIVGLSRHPKHGILVRAVWLRRASIDAMIDAAYDLHERVGFQRIGLEAQGFQRILFRDFDRAAARRGYHLPLVPVTQSTAKGMRIESLSPLHERGIVRYPVGFPGDVEVLREQLLSYPSRVTNDDGPDALEGAVRLVERGGVDQPFIQVGGGRFDAPPRPGDAARGAKRSILDRMLGRRGRAASGRGGRAWR